MAMDGERCTERRPALLGSAANGLQEEEVKKEEGELLEG